MWTNITFFVVQLALWIILFAVVKSTPIRVSSSCFSKASSKPDIF